MRDTTESGSVVVKCASGRRMNVKKLRPLDDALVVDNNVWLRKKRGETLGDVELFGAHPSVVCAARSPAVQERAVAIEAP
jgi:hypothetical protein